MKEDAIVNQEFEKAASLRDQENELKEEMKSRKEKWEMENQSHTQMVMEKKLLK